MIPAHIEFIVTDQANSEGYWVINGQEYEYLKPAATETMNVIGLDYTFCIGWLLSIRDRALGD